MTEDRTSIIRLGQSKEVGKWVSCGTQVVSLIEEVNREERQSNQTEVHIPGILDEMIFKNM